MCLWNIKNPSNFSKWWPCKSYLQVKSSFIFYFTAVRTQKPEEKATQNKKRRCYCKLHSLIAYWNTICMEFTFNFLITIKWYRFKLYVGTRSKKNPENMCHKLRVKLNNMRQTHMYLCQQKQFKSIEQFCWWNKKQ